jgi:aspartate kinase
VALIVQKFGGTSVGSLERIRKVADKVIEKVQLGHQVVVVLSAMAGETSRLLGLAHKLDRQPAKRELDMLLASGEQVSIALLSIALIERGYSSISLLADQIGISTDNHFGKARIIDINAKRLQEELSQGHIVIAAGFQGRDSEGNITTLGRGGSDTSAVAIAAAINASECQIFTDVDGVYTTDPRIEPNARRLPFVTFDEMIELASLGAKVLQIRAVEYAGKYDVPLRVLSSFEPGDGTLIGMKDREIPGETCLLRPVSGITYNRDEAMLSFLGAPADKNISAEIFTALGIQGIEVDMIVQNVTENGLVNIVFTIHRDDYDLAQQCLQQINQKYITASIQGDKKLVKISAVGNGMKSHAGVAGKMFAALADENIDIRLISTSEIKVSVLVEEKYLELAVRALHSVFELDTEL